jgi:hypothetical protein
MKPQNEQKEKPKNKYSQPVQVNLSGSSGIISYLKKFDSNPVLVTASSFIHSYCLPKYVLIRYENWFWISEHQQNSWILFNFQNKKISPEGY